MWTNFIKDINKGSCGLLEEALEDPNGETINTEAAGSCEVYNECCASECNPNELGIEEC